MNFIAFSHLIPEAAKQTDKHSLSLHQATSEYAGPQPELEIGPLGYRQR